MTSDLRPPRIDTGFHLSPQDSVREGSWYSLDPVSPTTLTPAVSDLSSSRPPTVLLSDSEHSSLPTNIYPLHAQPNISRFRSESRKLLSHVLGQLQRRIRPPSIYDAFASPNSDAADGRLSSLVGTVKDAVRFRSSRQPPKITSHIAITLEDSDDETDQEFSTDDTFNLLLQLKDVLCMSVAQGWHIFDDEYVYI
ncbi:hypothetical protein BDQ17DRAFT_364577 [Cyathus striatus]|nr:hypothetical protein BDQ17DRAFT_364577 [Cyathus striatus]